MPISQFTAWSAGNEAGTEDSPTILAANRQLPVFQIRGTAPCSSLFPCTARTDQQTNPSGRCWQGLQARVVIRDQQKCQDGRRAGLGESGEHKEEHTAVSQSQQLLIAPATDCHARGSNAQPVSSSPALIDLSSATKAAAHPILDSTSDAADALRDYETLAEGAQIVQDDKSMSLIDLSSAQKPGSEQAEQGASEEVSMSKEEGLESTSGNLAATSEQAHLPAASVQTWAAFGSPESKPLSQFRLERRYELSQKHCCCHIISSLHSMWQRSHTSMMKTTVRRPALLVQ